MGNEHRVDVFGLFANFGEAAREIADAQTGVDQYARFRSGQESRVTAAPAGQYTEPYDDKTLSLCFSKREGRGQWAMPPSSF